MNPKNTATTWRDVMPAIPLARGVPVINIKNGARKVVVKVEGGLPVLAMIPAVRPPVAPKLWRVDLGDLQGVAYGLQLLAQRHGRAMGDDYGDIIMRHLWGNTTDEDRLVLAQALAEVTRG